WCREIRDEVPQADELAVAVLHRAHEDRRHWREQEHGEPDSGQDEERSRDQIRNAEPCRMRQRQDRAHEALANTRMRSGRSASSRCAPSQMPSSRIWLSEKNTDSAWPSISGTFTSARQCPPRNSTLATSPLTRFDSPSRLPSTMRSSGRRYSRTRVPTSKPLPPSIASRPTW